MTAGRPTKYNPAYIQKIEEYLKTCSSEQMKLPKRVDIALMLDVDDETLIEWGKRYPDFSATLTRVDRLQHSTLVDTGIYGGKEVNANVIMMMLKSNHGYVETEKRILAGDKEEPLIIIQDENTPITVADQSLER